MGLERNGERVEVYTPSESLTTDDIPHDVFHQIDNADLIIADLSGNRGAVVYELAFAHALGIVTILVSRPADEIFFYSKMYHLNRVDFRADPLIGPSLDKAIDSWVRTRRKLHIAPNPLHKFYEAPLLDISAASGLAAGFYSNFGGRSSTAASSWNDDRSSRSMRNGGGSA